MQLHQERILTGLGLGMCIGFTVAIAIGAAADGPKSAVQPVGDGTTQTNTVAASNTAVERTTPVTIAVAEVAPSVVSITTEQPTQSLFGQLYGQPGDSNEGSGVVIDPTGVILTNAHVVSAASQITVTFSDGWAGEAEIIGLAEDLDLAVLKIPVRAGLRAVPMGTSSDLILGEPVIAIGNPFGLGHTVTTGVVSATSRPLETGERVLQDFIQTDASINPGNSGGPLLNASGELIGINTAIRPDAQGIGFAIPIDRATKVARDLMETGTVRLPWLGVIVQDVVFQSSSQRTTVPEVVHVLDTNGQTVPAFQTGDIIVGVQGRYVQGRADLNAFLASYSPGDTLDFTIVRSNAQKQVRHQTSTIDPDLTRSRLERHSGLRLSRDEDTQRPGITVEAVSRTGSAARIGIRPGDTIIAIDGARVRSTREAILAFQRALERHRSSALITVRRGHLQGRISLPI